MNDVDAETVNQRKLDLSQTKDLNKDCTKNHIHLLNRIRILDIPKLSKNGGYERYSNSEEVKISRLKLRRCFGSSQTQYKMTKQHAAITPMKKLEAAIVHEV